MELFTNTIRTRSPKDEAQEPSEPMPAPSRGSDAGPTLTSKKVKGRKWGDSLQRGGVGEDCRARGNSEELKVGSCDSGQEHSGPRCSQEGQ